MAAPRAVLVVGPAWVGDMVMAQSLFKLLKQTDPERAIDVVAPGWSVPLLARMPEVRRGIELDVGHGKLGLATRFALARRLREVGYLQAIVLPRSWKSALVPFLAGIPRRTGYRGEWRYGLLNDVRKLDPGILDQTVKRFVALGLDDGATLGRELPWPELRQDRDNWRRLATRFGLDDRRPVVALMPGAEYGPAKRWPVERFAELAARLVAAGLQVVILGSEKERGLGAEISRRADSTDVVDLSGYTALADVVDILGTAAAAVTNDSGLLHVAAAVGTHVTAIYGSSSPAFTPPLTAARSTIYLGLDCSPCFARTCPLGHFACMLSIGVPTVEQSVLDALAAQQ